MPKTFFLVAMRLHVRFQAAVLRFNKEKFAQWKYYLGMLLAEAMILEHW